MSKPFEFERYRLRNMYYNECPCCHADLDEGDDVIPQAEFDGKWVKAEDAIEREKVNAAEIARLKAELQRCERERGLYRSHVGDSLGLCFFIVREPGLISTMYLPIPGTTVEQWLREFYAEHADSQVDIVRVWADSPGCSSVEDGKFYLSGIEAMEHMPPADPDDDDD
jgi:hypothetical protein